MFFIPQNKFLGGNFNHCIFLLEIIFFCTLTENQLTSYGDTYVGDRPQEQKRAKRGFSYGALDTHPAHLS